MSGGNVPSVDRNPYSMNRCDHYRCRRSDLRPFAYYVLGQAFERWLCPAHAPPIAHNAHNQQKDQP